MWLTNKKTGKVFNTDWINDDAVRKERQINATKEQSKKLNAESNVKYEKMLSLQEKHDMIYAFSERTGINVNMSNIQQIPDDTFNMIFDTVENHINEYGKKNFEISEITMYADDEYFKKNDNFTATMSHQGTLNLNYKYFTKTKSELGDIARKSYEDKFHPKGDASSIIIHELGHARFYKVLSNTWVEDVMSKGSQSTIQDWSESYDICSSEDWLNKINVELYRKKTFYRKFIDKIDNFDKRIRESEYLKKRWGGRVTLGLRGLVNNEYNGNDGISRYAATDIHEMMAEAWADVVQNKDNASYMSKEVVNEFLRIK